MLPMFDDPPKLVAWRLSGNHSSIFQSHLPGYCSIPGDIPQTRAITQLGDSGLAGVTSNKLIHFCALQITSSTSYQSSLIEDCPTTHSTSTDQQYHPYIFPAKDTQLVHTL